MRRRKLNESRKKEKNEKVTPGRSVEEYQKDNNIFIVSEEVEKENEQPLSVKLNGASIKCQSEQLKNEEANFLLDTGADTNLIKNFHTKRETNH